MKFTQLIAAGLAVATLSIGVAAPAEAQRYDRGYSQDHRGNDHHDRRDDRRFRGRGYDRHHGYSQRCRTEWRHHRRVQICR
ncbi:hypothetical protein U1701_06785 [Sphingomonas sp. PB2P19]|uniref:hypothetical protein n=1 Tax=Sphingomonas rhamnosi TaxID=3096156 RepID=UPI002FCBD4BC